ncbi:glycosyltransferase family 4 protein [Ectopseudomonas guguanensis]|uniref:glycosyltransferase n=1 Tax=Ectopseudomonas guguanensis TaxID=1198456 RepID=UPI00257611BF|nr:glycosyltransferase [Pseudomonas guguanensis]WJH56527.1 glycosyltransferase family 4 protein [Pseudomonas guguanensis]
MESAAYRGGARLYLDIRDIFVENLDVLFPRWFAAPLQLAFGFLERSALVRADRVSLVSRGFLGYFQARYPTRHFPVFSNGVDEAFVKIAADMQRALPDPAAEPVKVLYAGNLGDGQGMHLILPELARRLRGRAHFRVVGAGGRLEPLREALRSMGLDNVDLFPPVAREQLLEFYREADVLFLHLNDYPAFKRVLPSKLFEYAATGKPIWAGVAGYAAKFVATEVDNAAIFKPCDIDGALESFERLTMQLADRSDFVGRHARRRIMDEMAQNVMQLLE